MGCCTGARVPPAVDTAPQQVCANCRRNLAEEVRAEISRMRAKITRSSRVVVPTRCPCGRENRFQVWVSR